MSLIASKPYPIRICYLKDEPKQNPAPSPVEDKVSLTFLSSFIQQERKSMTNQEEEDTTLITATQ